VSRVCCEWRTVLHRVCGEWRTVLHRGVKDMPSASCVCVFGHDMVNYSLKSKTPNVRLADRLALTPYPSKI
jgi:hypothetical protein